MAVTFKLNNTMGHTDESVFVFISQSGFEGDGVAYHNMTQYLRV